MHTAVNRIDAKELIRLGSNQAKLDRKILRIFTDSGLSEGCFKNTKLQSVRAALSGKIKAEQQFHRLLNEINEIDENEVDEISASALNRIKNQLQTEFHGSEFAPRKAEALRQIQGKLDVWYRKLSAHIRALRNGINSRLSNEQLEEKKNQLSICTAFLGDVNEVNIRAVLERIEIMQLSRRYVTPLREWIHQRFNRAAIDQGVLVQALEIALSYEEDLNHAQEALEALRMKYPKIDLQLIQDLKQKIEELMPSLNIAAPDMKKLKTRSVKVALNMMIIADFYDLFSPEIAFWGFAPGFLRDVIEIQKKPYDKNALYLALLCTHNPDELPKNYAYFRTKLAQNRDVCIQATKAEFEANAERNEWNVCDTEVQEFVGKFFQELENQGASAACANPARTASQGGLKAQTVRKETQTGDVRTFHEKEARSMIPSYVQSLFMPFPGEVMQAVSNIIPTNVTSFELMLQERTRDERGGAWDRHAFTIEFSEENATSLSEEGIESFAQHKFPPSLPSESGLTRSLKTANRKGLIFSLKTVKLRTKKIIHGVIDQQTKSITFAPNELVGTTRFPFGDITILSLTCEEKGIKVEYALTRDLENKMSFLWDPNVFEQTFGMLKWPNRAPIRAMGEALEKKRSYSKNEVPS